MLTKEMIRRKTNSITYKKGVDIYRSDRVSFFTVDEEDEEIDYVTGKVEGSYDNSYEVNIEYSVSNDVIENISCECLAFANYSGICKHCVALLLEYMNYKERQNILHEYVSKKEKALNEVRTMRKLKDYLEPVHEKKKQTTPEMKKLLTNHIRKRTLLTLRDSSYGKVQIEPLLTCNSHSLELEFKIGITHMYVLKDVFSFDNAIENSENFSYGVNLEFIHTIEAFAPESRPLIQFIRDWVQENKEFYIQRNYYGYSIKRIKKIPISVNDLEEVLGAINGNTVMASVDGLSPHLWKLTKDELPRKMTIKGKEDGIQIKINYLSGYQGKLENIYFHEGKIYLESRDKTNQISEFMKLMTRIPNHTAYIQKEDIPVFCRDLLPALEEHFECKKENFDEKNYGLLPARFEIYLDSPQKDFITCKVLAVYGNSKYNIYNKNQDILIRDQIKEIEIGRLVSSYCNAFDEVEQLMVAGEDEDTLYNFLVYGVPKMQEVAEVYISDAIKGMNVITAPKVAVGISLAGDTLELKVISEDMSKDELLEILSKYNRKKKFYRLKNGDFVNVAGEDIETLFELKHGLCLSDSQLRQNTIKVAKYRTLYLDAELKERTYLSVTKDKDFKALVRNMKTIEDNDYEIPGSLEPILREYQKRGYLWIKTLKSNGFCGLLADDMGLGKTLQVISYLLSEYLESKPQDNKRALIVCPASLVFNWNNEIQKFAPKLPVKMIVGTFAERQKLIQNSEKKDILVTSYDLLKRDISHYEGMSFHSEIIDESQYIKNSNTQAARAVKLIKADFKLALTGTPIENRLSELWSVFDYLMPGYLYSYQRFRDELESPIVQNQDDKAMKRLQKMITPFVLRRLKKEVLTDLPDKMEETIYARIEGEQRKLYDANVKKIQILLDKQSDEEFKKSKIEILSELTKLRQICCDPSLLYEDYKDGSAKIDICMELIDNAINGGHKILLFSQFTSMLQIIQDKLNKNKINYFSLTGSTSKEERINLVEKFNHDDTPVFCISLKAGGTGLNLTSADIVIHYDPWWNLAVQNQATDRAHRIGQKNVVSVYKLIVKGTIEEKIMKIQDRKKELAEQVLSGEGMKMGSFTREELLDLLE